MRRAITIGAQIGAGGTCLSSLPFLFHNWHPPEWVTWIIGIPIWVFHSVGFYIAQDVIHPRYCAPMGCRDLHLEWAFWWSLGINTVVGAAIGALAAWIKSKIGSRTSR